MHPLWKYRDENPFSARKYGGRQAQEKYGYVQWEANYLDSSTWKPYQTSGFEFNLSSDINTTTVRNCIMSGKDVFRHERYHMRIVASAKRKWGFLLNSLSWHPRDDTETWDYFHLEEVIRTLHLGEYVTEVTNKYLVYGPHGYYGASHAASKYRAFEYSRFKWLKQHTQGQANEMSWASHCRVVPFIRVQRAIMRKAFSGALSLALNAPSCEDDQYKTDSTRQRPTRTLISYGSTISYAWNRRLIQPARTSTTYDDKAKRWTTIAVDDEESDCEQDERRRISC